MTSPMLELSRERLFVVPVYPVSMAGKYGSKEDLQGMVSAHEHLRFAHPIC